MQHQSTEAFLLGKAVAALDSIQKHLIQSELKEALSIVNEAVRMMNEAINKLYYEQKIENKNE
jgi:hypothetical protein